MKTTELRIPTIETFLATWRTNAFDYYKEAIRKGREIEEDHKAWCQSQKEEYKANGERWYDALGMEHWKTTVKKYWEENKTAKNIKDYGVQEEDKRINKMLDVEIENKRFALIDRTEKKIGTITDASNLYIASNGEINGFIIGTEGKANVNTVYAGGYHIQRLHYRVLVNKVK
jgi:hypothetical protein